MNTRPKPGQTEEDLIRQNEEFLKLNKRKSENKEEDPKLEEEDKKRQKSDECGDDCIYTDPASILNNAKAPDVLLSDIQEKHIVEKKPVAPICSSTQAFPQPFRRDKMITTEGKKLSIFAQMQQKKTVQQEFKPTLITSETSSISQTAIKKVLGPSEAQRIYEENAKILAGMSVEEMLEEKQKLMEMINPGTLQFLKSRQQAASIATENVASTSNIKIEEVEMEVETEKKTVENVSFDFKQELESFRSASSISKHENESLAQLPIPPEEAQRWLHMDVVETEKLKWMSQLPPPKPLAPGTTYPARFHFNGSLLPPDSNLPVTDALHHHGMEPERAGYTLEELLLFSRSSNIQQRALGLTTIANILHLVKEGRLDTCLEEHILPQLVEAGIFSVLRFSLDDNVPMVIQAAAQAMASLLSSQPDEVCLTLLLGTSYGVSQPCMPCPLETEEKEKGDKPLTEGELRDHELLQLDVIKGALRTDIVPRIRYLLEVAKPDPRTVLALLEILTRLARHSRDIALAISYCPDLIAVLCKNFLPTKWWDSSTSNPKDMASVYGVPLAKNVKLLRVMAAQSKALALDLVHKYEVMKSILAYLATEPDETGVPDGASLLMESAYLWQTCLNYGLAVTHIGDFSSVLGKLINYHLERTKLRLPGTYYQEHAVALLSLTQRIVGLDPSFVSLLPKQLLYTLGPAVVNAAGMWLAQASENEPLSFSDLKMLGAVLDLISVMYDQMLRWTEVDAVSWLSQLEHLISSALIPFLQSQTFKQLSDNLSSHSSLLDSKTTSGRQRDARGLPSLGSVTWGQAVTLTLQATSPLPALQSVVAFIDSACKFHPQLTNKVIPVLLQTPGIQKYLTSISNVGYLGSDHWFSVWEVDLTYLLLKLAILSPILTPRVLHKAALNILPCIRIEHKNQARELLQEWVFHPRGFSDEESLTCSLNEMELSESSLQNSSTQATSIAQLLSIAYKNLPCLHICFAPCLGLNELIRSKTISQSYPAEGQALVPKDWPFLPLVILANRQQQAVQANNPERQQQSQNISNDEATQLVSYALQWILLLETLRPDAANQMLSITARFCRLACVFLAGSEVFLDAQVHSLIEANLIKGVMPSVGKLDFEEKIPGLTNFWDLYLQLVQQYAGESYGDKVFAQFILIPLQQKYPKQYKRLIWGEQAAVIRYLSLPINELCVGMDEFLEPMETDPMLLISYLRSLRSGLVRFTWSPILHRVACYHVSQYVKRGEDITLRTQLSHGIKTGPRELHSLL